MIRQVLANWAEKAAGRGLRRFAPLARQVLFARIAVTVLMVPSGVAAQAAAPASKPASGSPRSTIARISDPTARAIELDLGAVFRTQRDNGAYVFGDAHAALAAHPLLATMSLDAYYVLGNKGTLSQAAYSIGRYYTYLAGANDRDGDRVIESIAPWGGKDARVEDPAYNALLALDMRSLARANFELRRVMPALYWYDLARAVARATVASTLDADALYFYPVDVATNRPVMQWSPLGALPLLFDEFIGPNHAEAIAARHLAGWSKEFATRASGAGSDATLGPIERLAGVMVLRTTNQRAAADRLRNVRLSAVNASQSIALYATERATVDRSIEDPGLMFDLFYAIARSSKKFADQDIVRLERALNDVRSLAIGFPVSPVDNGEQSLRTVQAAVAQLREKLRVSAFWSAEDRAAFPGPDATIATGRLLDDVQRALRAAENALFAQRFGVAGLRVANRFLKDSAVVGEPVALDWELSTAGASVALKGLMAGVYGEALSPIGGGQPFSVAAGAPRRFSTKHAIKANPGTLRLVTFMIAVEDAAGNRGRYYVERSVYAHAPVGIVARFPRGRLISGARVPIELDMTRRARNSEPTRYYWFTPSGLRLSEGNQGSFAFGPEDTSAVKLHVEIPTPCRPGVFPFTLKFMTGEREAGTINASLFKPYQWAYLGPFPGGNLDKKFPPENGVALLSSYDGGKRKLQWMPAPMSACGPRGEVAMRKLVDAPGVSYLYTVVAVANETDIEARLVSTSPAALFVNGRRALANTSAAGDSTSGVVHLQADKNHILIKVAGPPTATVSFGLGNDDNLAADEFDNNLAELVEGYQELLARVQSTDQTPREARRLVTFTYDDPSATAVSVVGSFNGWSPDTHRLQKAADGHWEVTLSLAPGRYSYRFLIDQKKHVLDPSTSMTEPDGYGGKNSVVVVNR